MITVSSRSNHVCRGHLARCNNHVSVVIGYVTVRAQCIALALGRAALSRQRIWGCGMFAHTFGGKSL